MPPRRKLASVPAPKPRPKLRDSVDAAIVAMDWLKPSDMALADLARTVADQIDAAQERADLLQQAYAESGGDPGVYKRLQKLEALCDVAKAVSTNAQPLLLALRDLGGTPGARKVMRPEQEVTSRLAAFRNAAAGGARGDGAPGEDAAAG